MSVLRTPGQAIELIFVEMLEYDFEWHIFYDALSPFEGMLNRLRLDLGAGARFSMVRHL